MKTTTLPSTNSMNRSPLRLGFLLNALALALTWLAPSQLAIAQVCGHCSSASLANTAFGRNALPGDTGSNNTAIGDSALFSNTIGNLNTALGSNSLLSNTDGFGNTANGANALELNTSGGSNTATGFGALENNTIGSANTANGDGALGSNTTGTVNTAEGSTALASNTTGSNNIALGFEAGQNLTTGSNNIDIGNFGSAGESNTIRIGTTGTQVKTSIAGISGATVPGGSRSNRWEQRCAPARLSPRSVSRTRSSPWTKPVR